MVGSVVGSFVGSLVGSMVGSLVGSMVGSIVGSSVGALVGLCVFSQNDFCVRSTSLILGVTCVHEVLIYSNSTVILSYQTTPVISVIVVLTSVPQSPSVPSSNRANNISLVGPL